MLERFNKKNRKKLKAAGYDVKALKGMDAGQRQSFVNDLRSGQVQSRAPKVASASVTNKSNSANVQKNPAGYKTYDVNNYLRKR